MGLGSKIIFASSVTLHISVYFIGFIKRLRIVLTWDDSAVYGWESYLILEKIPVNIVNNQIDFYELIIKLM